MIIGILDRNYCQFSLELLLCNWEIVLYLFRPDRQGGSLAVMEQLVEANYNMENIYMI